MAWLSAQAEVVNAPYKGISQEERMYETIHVAGVGVPLHLMCLGTMCETLFVWSTVAAVLHRLILILQIWLACLVLLQPPLTFCLVTLMAWLAT